MLGFTSIPRLLSGVACSKSSYTRFHFQSVFTTIQRSTIHTTGPSGPSGLSPSGSPFSRTTSSDLGRHFWSVDSNNTDREHINARCTTIKPPTPQAPGSSASATPPNSSPGELQIEHVRKISKVKLCKENGIQPRDLRSLDTDMHDLPASILVRSESIIFCTPTIRAIIKADKLLMLEPLANNEVATEQSETPSLVVDNVMAHIHALGLRAHHTNEIDTQIPFEFIALESLLSQEIHSLSGTSTELTNRVNKLLSSMSSQDVISTAQMQEMIEVKDANELYLRAATSVKDAVAEILSEPDDMRRMYLSDLRAGRVREFGDDDEVELLLETYLKYASSMSLTASRNLQRLNSASSHLQLLLSSTRNRLLHLEIRLAIATLAVSAGALPATIFGMNLANHFEDHPWAFYVTTALIGLIALAATQAGRASLRIARRVKMEQAGLLAGGKQAIRPPARP